MPGLPWTAASTRARRSSAGLTWPLRALLPRVVRHHEQGRSPRKVSSRHLVAAKTCPTVGGSNVPPRMPSRSPGPSGRRHGLPQLRPVARPRPVSTGTGAPRSYRCLMTSATNAPEQTLASGLVARISGRPSAGVAGRGSPQEGGGAAKRPATPRLCRRGPPLDPRPGRGGPGPGLPPAGRRLRPSPSTTSPPGLDPRQS